MNKYLYASTVLATMAVMGGGFAVQAADITISGNSKFSYQSWSDEADNENGRNDTKMLNESHIAIKAEQTADNGLTYGTSFKIEAEDSKLTEDGHSFYVSGDFGKLVFGGSSAGDTYYADVFDRNITEERGTGKGLPDVGYSTAKSGGEDEVVAYHTPEISGFKAGVSFADAGDTSGADVLEWGVQFSTALAGGGLTLRYANGSKDSNGSTLAADGTGDDADIKATSAEESATSIGADFTIGGLGIHLSQNKDDNEEPDGDKTSEREVTAYGISYKASDAMSLALGKASAEDGNKELDMTAVSVNYTIATGLTTGLGYTTWEGKNAADNEQDGTHTSVFLNVSF